MVPVIVVFSIASVCSLNDCGDTSKTDCRARRVRNETHIASTNRGELYIPTYYDSRASVSFALLTAITGKPQVGIISRMASKRGSISSVVQRSGERSLSSQLPKGPCRAQGLEDRERAFRALQWSFDVIETRHLMLTDSSYALDPSEDKDSLTLFAVSWAATSGGSTSTASPSENFLLAKIPAHKMQNIRNC